MYVSCAFSNILHVSNYLLLVGAAFDGQDAARPRTLVRHVSICSSDADLVAIVENKVSARPPSPESTDSALSASPEFPHVSAARGGQKMQVL